MKIVHRISINKRSDSSFATVLHRMGLLSDEDVGAEARGMVAFEIEESDTRWDKVQALVKKYGGVHITQTFFDKDEIIQAEIVRLVVIFERGYPQPEATWVSQKPNYNLLCPRCNSFQQVESFHIKDEPSLGGNNFMTLLWGSPVFLSIETYNQLKESGIKGFEPWDVIIQKTGLSSGNIVQLKVTKETTCGLIDGEALGFEKCDDCGERKYYSHRRGVMRYRRDAIPPNIDIMETAEWFGAGSKRAYKEILIRNKLARLILDQGWKGVMMKVVELMD
jgi:hypothetical protein